MRAATGGFLGLMIAMLFVYPAYYGVDEAAHFDMSYAYSQGHAPYAPGERWEGMGVITPELNGAFIGAPPTTSFADTRPIPRSMRLSIDAGGGDAPSTVSNQMTQHPPLYYLLGAAVLDVPGVSHLAYDWQIALLRVLSMVLMAPIPWLFWKTARTLGAGDLAPVASLVPLLVPAFVRSGASVTNDSLLILSFGAVLYLLSRVVTGDGSRRTAGWIAFWILVALLTKGFALQLPLVAGLGYLVCWWRHRLVVWRQVGIVAAGSVVGGIWWAHNVIAYGTVQPDGFAPGFFDSIVAQLSNGHGHLGEFLQVFGNEMMSRFWGSLGILEPPHGNYSFAVAATTVLLALMVVGVIRGIAGRGGWAGAVVLVLPLPLTLLLLAKGAWPIWAGHHVPAGMQGRYLFPALLGVAAVAVAGLSWLVRGGRARALMAPAVLLAALYTQIWSFREVLGQWWYPRVLTTRRSMYQETLRALAAWAPWPAWVSVLLGLVVVALTLRLLYVVARSTVAAWSSSPPRRPGLWPPVDGSAQADGACQVLPSATIPPDSRGLRAETSKRFARRTRSSVLVSV